ncbi:MAG TPA: radical SAM protein, partial [Clostridiales bacterium]|nr:radical SAM protein [Clostridiales bacterium]
ITAARELGCKYIQLNSNGIRLAEDESYVKKLADAGLSFVFMQFDGIDDEVYLKLRGKQLFATKEKAIENCGKYGLGVTLVPTIVPGINSMQIGDILRYGIMRSPTIRGVHFQPVGHLGRIPSIPENHSRFTLDELLFEIEEQTKGLVKAENLLPSHCDHPLCGFHGDFIIRGGKTLYPLSKKRNDIAPCSCGIDA